MKTLVSMIALNSIAATLLVAPAHANLLEATFKGEITSGPDLGKAVTAVIDYDTSQGSTTSFLDETTFMATGGERAVVTIGGQSIVSPGVNLMITNVNNPPVDTSSTSFNFGGTNGYIDASLVENPTETPGAPGLDIPNDFNAFYSATGTGTGELNFGTYETVAYSSVSVQAGTALAVMPLPASAPMFGTALMALGAVGCGLKRKRRVAQV
jgi:hypothetical protein